MIHGRILTHAAKMAVTLGLIALVACSSEGDVAARELASVRVSGVRLLETGQAQSGVTTFRYKLYSTTGDPEDVVAELPNESYQPIQVGANVRAGFGVLQAWRGPDSRGQRECLITQELMTDTRLVPKSLTAEDIADLNAGELSLVRLTASCTQAQHSFDESPST